MVNGYPNVFMIILSGKHYRPALHHSGLFLLYEITLIICFAIGSECFARRGSKGSLPVHILSRAGYCGARPCKVRTSSAIIFIQGRSFAPTPRLPFGSYSDSLALATVTFFDKYLFSCAAVCWKNIANVLLIM